MREYNEMGMFKVIDRWIFLLKICPNCEQHQKHMKKDLFQNFLIITCKKGLKNPVFSRVFLGEGRNEGCPLKGIDTYTLILLASDDASSRNEGCPLKGIDTSTLLIIAL